jgi:hypothetical protein
MVGGDMQAFKIRYTPGDSEPSATSNTQRVILAWRKARDEYYEREQIRQMQEERYANREPETISEFEQVERDKIARQRQQAISEAEEDRHHAQQQKEAQERLRQQAKEKDKCYIQYWEATNATERTSWLIRYAQATGTADGYSGGFATQGAVDRTIASLQNINNAPSGFRSRLREIRNGPLHEYLVECDQPKPVEPSPEPEEIVRGRFLKARREVGS